MPIAPSLRRSAARFLAVALFVPATIVAAPSGARAATTVSTVTAVSEQGDSIGAGSSYVWRPGLGTVSASRDDQGRVVVQTGGAGVDAFTFTLAGPGGADLAVGTYEGARDFASPTSAQAGLEVSAGGRSCLTSAGRFHGRDFAADLSHLLIHYETGCDGGRPALLGEIRINMPVPAGPLVTPSAIVWPDTEPSKMARGVPVYIAHTGGGVYTYQGIGSSEQSEFSTHTTCITLTPGASCTALVNFAPQGFGPRSATLTVGYSPAPQSVALSGTGAPPIVVGKPPAAASFLRGYPGFDSAALSWINPPDLDWSETVIRGAEGQIPPATMNEGFPVYSGREASAAARNLKPGSVYSFSAFARDTEGLVAPPATSVSKASR